MGHRAEEQPILIGETGPLDEQRWTIGSTITAGRDANCEIVVADRQVSREHARFTYKPDGVYVEDLGSKNGTHVNGQRINQTTLLQDGDVVQIALAQKFTFLSSDATLPLESTDLLSPFEANLQGPLRMDTRARRVYINDEEISPPLSVAQFTMLELLHRRGGRVVTREELIRAIWGEEEAYTVSNQALDALVRRLRDRLSEIDDSHEYVVTVRGHGLRLDNLPEEEEQGA
ncbi:MAG: FHA domain-containing protein [Chloroflexi bacterium]|nr:MAG: FHA domain-containing protein [Chloroflexota bacterium]MBL1196188.1 FHA domain-containing protein [Chloroflexota bacterium]NOH13481.1 FHA domain-containing protein [Chloroflexota bacterium]